MSPSRPFHPTLSVGAGEGRRYCKESLLLYIRAVFRRREMEKKGKKCRADLGMDLWDGFTWAEQRQYDGRRVERAWDRSKKEWTVVPHLGSERNASPCKIGKSVVTEDEDEELGVEEEEKENNVKQRKCKEECPIQNSFLAARMTFVCQEQINHAKESISGHSERAIITACRGMMASDCGQERSHQEHTSNFDSDGTTRLSGTVNEGFPELTHSSSSVMDESLVDPPGLSGQATKEYFSAGNDGIWKATTGLAARIYWKSLEFWKPTSGQRPVPTDSQPGSGEAMLPASLEGGNLPERPTKPDLDGLGKLIRSIDMERVNKVRHIWHAETGQWTHERIGNR